MRVQFVTIDKDTPDFLPASVQDYIAENHLARFILEIMAQLDLKNIDNHYSGHYSGQDCARRYENKRRTNGNLRHNAPEKLLFKPPLAAV